MSAPRQPRRPRLGAAAFTLAAALLFASAAEAVTVRVIVRGPGSSLVRDAWVCVEWPGASEQVAQTDARGFIDVPNVPHTNRITINVVHASFAGSYTTEFIPQGGMHSVVMRLPGNGNARCSNPSAPPGQPPSSSPPSTMPPPAPPKQVSPGNGTSRPVSATGYGLVNAIIPKYSTGHEFCIAPQGVSCGGSGSVVISGKVPLGRQGQRYQANDPFRVPSGMLNKWVNWKVRAKGPWGWTGWSPTWRAMWTGQGGGSGGGGNPEPPEPPEPGDDPVRARAAFKAVSMAFLHDRCVNCHSPRVSSTAHVPDGFGHETRRQHNNALITDAMCVNCHVRTNRPSSGADAPVPLPGSIGWRRAPDSMTFRGKSITQICNMIKSNAGSAQNVVRHIEHDKLVEWGFKPECGVGNSGAGPCGMAAPAVRVNNTSSYPSNFDYFKMKMSEWAQYGGDCP